jgi:fatty-acid peroxygenase
MLGTTVEMNDHLLRSPVRGEMINPVSGGDLWIDRTPEALAKGYRFLPDTFRRKQADITEIRLLGRRAVCITGKEAAEIFYDERRFERAGALPIFVQKTLFGIDPVHALDGAAHVQRKGLFLALLTSEAAERIGALATHYWELAADSWESKNISVLDEAAQVFGLAIASWAGIPDERLPVGFGAKCAAIVDGFASIGPRHLKALLARRKLNAWSAALIEDVRTGRIPELAADCPLAVVAAHRALDGRLLDARVAGSELLNICRPAVAVARFVAFSLVALAEVEEWRDRLISGSDEEREAFANEVRRLYPFVPALGARVKRQFAWRGRWLPAGRLVILDVYGTLHRPSLWRDPNRFCPERFLESTPPDPFAFIPQGGGELTTGHRCPGERVTLELIKSSATWFANREYSIPPQELEVSLSRMPAQPRSGYVISKVCPLKANR